MRCFVKTDHPKRDKHLTTHMSQLLFKCCFVACKRKQVIQKQISILPLIFNRLTVVEVLFCSLKRRINPKIRMLCFVIMYSLLFNLLCVWILKSLDSSNHTIHQVTEFIMSHSSSSHWVHHVIQFKSLSLPCLTVHRHWVHHVSQFKSLSSSFHSWSSHRVHHVIQFTKSLAS